VFSANILKESTCLVKGPFIDNIKDKLAFKVKNINNN